VTITSLPSYFSGGESLGGKVNADCHDFQAKALQGTPREHIFPSIIKFELTGLGAI
jgi:hypothetical protein